MKIKLVPPIPDNRRIQLDLSLDEAMVIQAALSTVPVGLLNRAGNGNANGHEIWQTLTKTLKETGIPLRTIEGGDFSKAQCVTDDYLKYFR